jgi:hypothetical protein
MWITCTSISHPPQFTCTNYSYSWNLFLGGINYLFLAFQSLIILAATPLAGYRQINISNAIWFLCPEENMYS